MAVQTSPLESSGADSQLTSAGMIVSESTGDAAPSHRRGRFFMDTLLGGSSTEKPEPEDELVIPVYVNADVGSSLPKQHVVAVDDGSGVESQIVVSPGGLVHSSDQPVNANSYGVPAEDKVVYVQIVDENEEGKKEPEKEEEKGEEGEEGEGEEEEEEGSFFWGLLKLPLIAASNVKRAAKILLTFPARAVRTMVEDITEASKNYTFPFEIHSYIEGTDNEPEYAVGEDIVPGSYIYQEKPEAEPQKHVVVPIVLKGLPLAGVHEESEPADFNGPLSAQVLRKILKPILGENVV